MNPMRFDIVDTINEEDPSLSILRAIRIGSRWYFAARFVQEIGPPKVYQNLSGRQWRFDASESKKSANHIFSASTAPGANIPITFGEAGILLQFSVPTARTRGLSDQMGWYSLYEMIGPDKVPYMEGKLQIVHGGTK